MILADTKKKLLNLIETLKPQLKNVTIWRDLLMSKLKDLTKCTVIQLDNWGNRLMNQTHLSPRNWSVSMFKWLRIKKLKSWRSKLKFSKLSRINRLQLMIRNFKPWKKLFRPRWTNIRFYWTIKPLCSRKCTLKLILWSTEPNKLSKMRKKLPLWNMKSTLISLRLNRKLLSSRNFKKSSKLEKLSTKIWKNKLESWRDNVMNLSKSSDKRKKNSKPWKMSWEIRTWSLKDLRKLLVRKHQFWQMPIEQRNKPMNDIEPWKVMLSTNFWLNI